MEENKNNFTFEEKIVADEVADEILTVKDDKDRRRYFFLVLLFLICLIFLISSLSFAIFDTYYNGGVGNVVDVGIKVNTCDVNCDTNGDGKCDLNCDTDGDGKCNINCDIDNDKKCNINCDTNDDGKCDLNCDTDKDGICDVNCKGDETKPSKPSSDSDPKPNPPVQPGSILFSFNEGSNYINMTNVYPTADNIGKKLTGNGQYFDFNISASLNGNKSGEFVYEISLLPVGENTIDSKDVRVYLTESEKPVSINTNGVNNFSDLPDSKYREGGKVIYRKTIFNDYNGNYVFRMWLSHSAKVADTPKMFGCKVMVDAYYK